MLVVALTGGIGSGKSEAGRIFSELGAVVVDSDELAREVIERGTSGFEEILVNFGDEVLTNGVLDRSKLAEIVFDNPDRRKVLEEIIHPRVREAFEKIVENCAPNDVVINVIPLLVETNGAKRFDRVIAITAPQEIREKRLISRGLPTYQIAKRIAAQATDVERERISDFVIDNSGSKDDLLQRIEILYEKLKNDAANN